MILTSEEAPTLKQHSAGRVTAAGEGLMGMGRIRTGVLGTLATMGTLALSATPALASTTSQGQAPGTYFCTGGAIPTGNYRNIVVTGACAVPAGAVIRVYGDVEVRAGAVLDAQNAPSTITIDRNVRAGKGALLGLGCQPPSLTGNSAHPCTVDPEGHSTITVKRSITATKASAVLLNGITVKRDVTLWGGGSTQVPWSIKNNKIGGNLTVGGQTTSWLGVLFNNIGRNATLKNITVVDEHPDAPGVYVVRNTIGRNLICEGLAPGVSGGFVPGSVNVVGRHAIGQCAGLV